MSADRLNGTVGGSARRTYRVRLLVQGGFALTCVLLGVQFSRFVVAAQAGREALPVRPPGVEGFLPISGLMGLVDWLCQGELNDIHPAATVLFLIALATSAFVRKSFCGWICPAGLLSETLARLGRRLLRRDNLRLPRGLDVPLRGLKYLLLAFFLWAILGMSAAELQEFVQGPYNRVSDVKMGLFFVELGAVAAAVLAILVMASVFVEGAWCRYLCPYGALLGLVARLSPVRIRRDPDRCIDCGACDRACMARLPVARAGSVWSVECTGCLDCVATCPVPDTLELRTPGRGRLSPLGTAAAILLLFFAGYVGARATGAWRNAIPDSEYVERIRAINDPIYRHP